MLLIVLIVVLPTAAVLWLVSEATENERLAVRQRLADAYLIQLDSARKSVLMDWQKRLGQLKQTAADSPPPAAFAACVRGGLADSVIVLDSAGRPAYPAIARATATAEADATEDSPAWQAARQLEFSERNFAAAGEAYAAISRQSRDKGASAVALQGQIRSLLAGGDKRGALEIIKYQMDSPRLKAAVAADGRWVWADLMLLGIETAKDSDPALASEAAKRLETAMADYGAAPLGSAQRRFVMHRLQQIAPAVAAPTTLAAEDLAATCLEQANAIRPAEALAPTGLPDVWMMALPGRRALALFRTSTLVSFIDRGLSEQPMPPGVRVAAVSPAAAESGAFLTSAIGPDLPSWRLALSLTEDPFGEAASRRSRAYYWIAALTIAATVALAVLAAAAVRRQMRLSRLKNDLVATVSHELKTPLTSMRLLVDTLLDQERLDEPQAREYLQLVARENERLSRLIDNFLTFSRLERGKQRFAAEAVDPAEVARRAVEALDERLTAPACHFELRIDPELPAIIGDFDALVMVAVNLLDNALKYSGAEKRIALRVWPDAQQVCLAVEDNGLGLSPRDRRRVFDRFYQVDQRLSRAAGGCGLGLSIVERIVAAHAGSIEVESKLGHGSKFLVKLPAVKPAMRRETSCPTS